MDIAVMEECTRASHEERITFGEVVGRLSAAGVEPSVLVKAGIKRTRRS